MRPFRAVIALGGNALLKRGEKLSSVNQEHNLKAACSCLAKLFNNSNVEVASVGGSVRHAAIDVVLTHGNGPQVGLLAMQNLAYKNVEPYPLDLLVSETEGMIGYALERHLMNVVPDGKFATLLTQVEVSVDDPAFQKPTKFIGPMWTQKEANEQAERNQWKIAQDGDGWRRVVPSPSPISIVQLHAIRLLVENGITVICGGGGGIPVARSGQQWEGIEAVVDKDLCSSMLADQLDADALLLLTDIDGVYKDFKTVNQRRINTLQPADVSDGEFPAGSMGPKVDAACAFVAKHSSSKRRFAAIGSLTDVVPMLAQKAGTIILPSQI